MSLRVRGLQTAVIGPLELRLDGGECVTLHGPSGAGKSLLLRAIADLDPNQADSLSLDGQPRSEFSPANWRRQVCLVPAEAHWWAPRVADHFGPLAIEPASLGLPDEVLGWSTERLSSGERQRLAILRALSFGPRCLLLDEPTANLDAANGQRVEALARQLCDDGLMLLWVSHDAAQRERVSQRQLLIRDGQLAEEAQPA